MQFDSFPDCYQNYKIERCWVKKLKEIPSFTISTEEKYPFFYKERVETKRVSLTQEKRSLSVWTCKTGFLVSVYLISLSVFSLIIYNTVFFFFFFFFFVSLVFVVVIQLNIKGKELIVFLLVNNYENCHKIILGNKDQN